MILSQDRLNKERKNTVMQFQQWLFRFMYRYGVARGQCKALDRDDVYQIPRLKLAYYSNRAGNLKVHLDEYGDPTYVLSGNEKWNDFEILGSNEYMCRPINHVIGIADAIEAIALHTVPHLEIPYSPRLCQSGLCDPLKGMEIVDGEYTANSYRLLCTNFGGRYVCDDCINLLSLNEHTAETVTNVHPERLKMTASLRFSILERDGFACKSCGRTPREDGIKLHVDHILAIDNGGKTVPENLHTLCKDCNLGKGTKRVGQMELWQ